ncbi:MAG: PLP-dependent aminotransferase family protein [Flavobacterium sp.]
MNTNNSFTIKIILQHYLKDSKAKDKKYNHLYQSIKKCITKHELPHGWTLPSTRFLADSLNLSRTTVLKAYDFLSLENLIKPKPGSGYIVIYEKGQPKRSTKKSKNTNLNTYVSISNSAEHYFDNLPMINRESKHHIAFRPGLPPLDIFPVNQWKKLLNLYWSSIKFSELTYSNSSGIRELKYSISKYLSVSRNVNCSPEQVFVVSGSLQSLFLIANVLIEKNDTVILENPTFPNVHSIFKSLQANLIPLQLDQEGININEKKLNDLQPKIIHVTPSNHYPLGIKMSLKRRLEVLNFASNTGSYIIENDYENEIANHDEKTPTLFSLDKEDRTLYLGTFNRLLHPSIRLGYMVAPKNLVPYIEALQELSHRFVSPSLQVVMNQFIEKNYIYLHIKNCIEAALERHNLFTEAFSKKISKMEIHPAKVESFHTIARFKAESDYQHENEIVKQLKLKGITTFPLSKCYIEYPKEFGLIFGYAAVRPSIIQSKINTMAEVIKS